MLTWIIPIGYFIAAMLVAKIVFVISFHMTTEQFDPDSYAWDLAMDENKFYSLICGIIWPTTLIFGFIWAIYRLLRLWIGGGMEQKYVERWKKDSA